MIDWLNLFAFLTASVLLTLLPGPDTLFVISQSITNGRKAGILFALGLCTGLIAHTAAASFGISIIFQESPLLFKIVKILGAVYIAWLGIAEIIPINKGNNQHSNKAEQTNLYRRGIIMNLLNPKVALFFLAFLPQFVSTDSSNVSREMFILGLIFIIQAIIVFSILAIVADHLSNLFLSKVRHSKTVGWTKAALFLIIAVYLIF